MMRTPMFVLPRPVVPYYRLLHPACQLKISYFSKNSLNLGGCEQMSRWDTHLLDVVI